MQSQPKKTQMEKFNGIQTAWGLQNCDWENRE